MSLNTGGDETARGVAYGLAAYTIWGCFPLFFSLLDGIPAWEILVHRVVWSCAFLLVLIILLGRWRQIVDALSRPAGLGKVLVCAVLIGANWGIFIHAIETRQVFQSSLGYFLTPLVNVALGMLVLKERMARGQQWAVALAGVAIAAQLLWMGTMPWVALLLALTFGTYGLFRKQVRLEALPGLFVETLLLLPFGLIAFAWLIGAGASSFPTGDSRTYILLLSGVVTALPLIAFGAATRRLRLATVGFLMYINPTMQFLTAWLVFRETLHGIQALSFVLIWVALGLYSWSSWKQRGMMN